MPTHLGMCIGHAGGHVSTTAGQKRYIHTDTLLDVELKTLGNTLANKITQAPFYAVAERLAEVKAETLGDNTGRCEITDTQREVKTRAFLDALSYILA